MPGELTVSTLDAHRRVQRLAFSALLEVAERLTAGMTERDVCRQIGEAVRLRGGHGWFHTPIAWFGARTFFAFARPLGFLPSRRRLEPGMPVILDVAPAVAGYVADVGYSCSLGPNPELDRLRAALAELRGLILGRVRAGATLRQIYDSVDAQIARRGLINCHAMYPLGAFAHRVGRLRLTRLPLPSLGLGLEAVSRLAAAKLRTMLPFGGGRSPIWSKERHLDEAPAPGLWAVEPHVGIGQTGAKWEELLVVTATDAYWLDDQVPHALPRAHGEPRAR